MSGGRPSDSNLSLLAVRSVKTSRKDIDPLIAITMLDVLWSAMTQKGSCKKKDNGREKNDDSRRIQLCAMSFGISKTLMNGF